MTPSPTPSPTGPAPAPGDDFVQALARGLEVITAFDAEHGTMTLSAVAARTGLSRATARRLLRTLVELGYVRSDGRDFTLTPRVLRLGAAYLSGMGLPELCQPHLERLSARLGESTSAAVLDGGDVVYVARVATRRIMTVGITVGTRFPAHATSLGRVLLAGLDEDRLDAWFAEADLVAMTGRTLHDEAAVRAAVATARDQGWAVVDQELEVGLRSVAAPVTDPGGTVVAALNVSTAVAASPTTPVSDLVAAVSATAAAVSHDLASSAFATGP